MSNANPIAAITQMSHWTAVSRFDVCIWEGVLKSRTDFAARSARNNRFGSEW